MTEGDSKRGEGRRSQKGWKMQWDDEEEGEEDIRWKEQELSKAWNMLAVKVWMRLKQRVWLAQ